MDLTETARRIEAILLRVFNQRGPAQRRESSPAATAPTCGEPATMERRWVKTH